MRFKLHFKSPKIRTNLWIFHHQGKIKPHIGLLMLMAVCLISYSGFSQELSDSKEKLIAYKQDKMLPLKQVLKNLEKTHNISFNYNSNIVENKFVNPDDFENKNLDKSLNATLGQLGLNILKLDTKTYVIQTNSSNNSDTKKKSSNIEQIKSKQLNDQSLNDSYEYRKTGINQLEGKNNLNIRKRDKPVKTVSGSVKTASGEGLPGVNVIVKGTSVGTVTDINGTFSLEVPEDKNVLVFSSVGFLTQEVEIGVQSNIEVVMQDDIGQLKEIVVVGYGTQERAKVTGAIASISSADIDNLPVISADQALQGKAAGVNVINTGSPGENPLVRIRGIGTVNNNNPLYVIDGVPSGGLNSINPNDIESMEVLKDASTAAIYGSRASNGVILITTKKGKSGKAKVTLDSYVGTQKAWKKLDLLNRDQYIAYANDLLGNAGITPGSANYPSRLSNLGAYANINTDWQDEMFQTASIQDHNVSVSGGTENFTYLIGAGHFEQGGIMIGTDFKRTSFRANTEIKIGNRIKIGQTLTLAESNRNRENQSGGRNQIEHIIKSIPYLPVRDETRIGGFKGPDAIDGSDAENPVLIASLYKNQNKNFKMLGTAYMEVDIYKGLKARGFIGLDFDFSRNYGFTNIFNAGDYHANPSADINNSQGTYMSPVANLQLIYDRQFGKHKLNVVGLVEGQKTSFENVTVAGETTQSTDIKQPGFFTTSENIGGGLQENAIMSYVGRLTYDFADKYLLTLSIRRDGSSKFAKDIRWGNFPSVSAGWRVSEEEFMKGISNIVSEFKIRGSYGQTGNNQTGNYGFVPTIYSNTRYGSGRTGGTINRLANAALTWEKTKMLNVGFDAGFLDSKFTLSVDWFKNTTTDVILPVPIPFSLGYDIAPDANVGEVENTGLEILLGYRQNIGEFHFNMSGNITFVKNKLLKLATEGSALFGPDFEGIPTTKSEVGQPIAYFFGYQTVGIFQSQSEVDGAPTQTAGTRAGDIRFKDVNGDGQITAADRVNIGHFLPDFSYGLTIEADWKGFDLSMFFQGVYGNEILNTNLYDLEGMTRLFNAGTNVLNRWTPTNTNTNVPRAVNADPNNNARLSNRYIEDGSYLRLKNLTIGYSLPASALPKNFISRIRLYVTGQNLLTFTKYSGYDPEIGVSTNGQRDNPTQASLSTGVDLGQYPQPRTLLGGIQITF